MIRTRPSSARNGNPARGSPRDAVTTAGNASAGRVCPTAANPSLDSRTTPPAVATTYPVSLPARSNGASALAIVP